MKRMKSATPYSAMTNSFSVPAQVRSRPPYTTNLYSKCTVYYVQCTLPAHVLHTTSVYCKCTPPTVHLGHCTLQYTSMYSKYTLTVVYQMSQYTPSLVLHCTVHSAVQSTHVSVLSSSSAHLVSRQKWTIATVHLGHCTVHQ